MTLLSAVAPVEETPVDRYLAEQADLTAVERFARRHQADLVPSQARYYRDLIPLVRPEPGQQYGFEVDLDACTGCKACVAACHSLNGLDEGESWRSVSLLHGGTPVAPFQQTVTSACHHCVDPACLSGCPVDAYEKDPFTGIVSHLDDQCIGCGYCMLTCPYEVPVFNHDRGIVRKCDMCKDRLATGEAPACVQACPNGAIAIKVVDTAVAVAHALDGVLVPGAPPSSITTPTTVYRSAKGHVRDLPARTSSTEPARGHPPLAVMLVLTQLSVGAFVCDFLLRTLSRQESAGPFDALVAVAAGMLALGASVFHLGRPRYCYRAVIGLRHSWLSREVVAFGAFTGLSGPYALLLWLHWPVRGHTAPILLAVAAVVFGLAGVASSVMVYAATHRASWRAPVVAGKFVLTTAACGLATVTWASLVSSMVGGNSGAARVRMGLSRPLLLVLATVMVVKLVGEAVGTRSLPRRLRPTMVVRFSAGLAGGVVLPFLLVGMGGPTWSATAVASLSLAGVAAGELLERLLFFTAASPPR